VYHEQLELSREPPSRGNPAQNRFEEAEGLEKGNQQLRPEELNFPQTGYNFDVTGDVFDIAPISDACTCGSQPIPGSRHETEWLVLYFCFPAVCRIISQ
jgi:hypothetical protein